MSFITDKQLTDMPSIELKSFHIKNYKGIIDTKVENIPSGTQWIFLTGENGFGKTSVLQALAEGLNRNLHHPIQSEDIIKVDVTDPILATLTKEELLTYGFIHELLYDQFVAYGSSRLRISGGTPLQVLQLNNATNSLYSNETLLLNIEQNFKDWYKEYPEGKKKLESLFIALLPNLYCIDVEFNDKKKSLDVVYYEKDISGNKYENGLLFEDLAAGYRNIIGMIGDMFYRFSSKQNVDDYSDLEGIVLIDEFELHLHPKYQKLFVEKLTELFPKIQFIVSTHSPIPLLGAPANSVIINVTRTKEEGIQAKLLDIDFSVLTPNTILSSPIFGFQDLIPDSKSNEKMVRTEDTYKEVLFHDQLDKQIDEFLTDDRKQELLDLLKEK